MSPLTDLLAPVRRGTRAWWIAAILAAVFLMGHLPYLASTLEDIDSVNFALGLRDFDPGRHRPHPPGYPIYMALGKIANTVVSEPQALAIWGALFGALSAFALLRLFGCLDALDGSPAAPVERVTPRRLGEWLGGPAVAAALTMMAPLFWMTASRPMSDTAGLAASLTAQAILATALVKQREQAAGGAGAYDAEAAALSGRLILLGAFMSAIAVGFRSQGGWLTLPLLARVLFDRAGRGAAGALIGSAVWFVVGTSLWTLPLVIASGGPAAYYTALTSQAGEDWSGVGLLATNVSLRRLAFAVYDTMIRHWAGMGWLVVAAAALGVVVMLWRGRHALVALSAAFVPYAIFHLLFQETVTTRYALPLVPGMAYLAVRGLFSLRPVGGSTLAWCLALGCLISVPPVTARYARAGSPVAHALIDIRSEAGNQASVAVGMHHPFARPVEADSLGRAVALAAPPKHEWLELGKRWRAGGRGPVWFLADPKRTDLALIDPQAQIVRAEYSWPFSSRVYLGGIRPDGLRWVVINEPGWFAGEGWHLTPETAGLASADGRGLNRGPITAWVRRRNDEAVVMVGGRHLGSGAGPSAHVSLRIDGREIDHWVVPPSAPSFLRFVPLPAGALSGDTTWSTLEIQSMTDGGEHSGIVAIDQFDLQAPATPMLGFGDGWHEPEYTPAQGLSWRWASGKAVLRTSTTDRDVELQIVGESPRRYFDRPSRVVATAGAKQLWSLDVAEDFAWSFRIPASALKDSNGTITIDTDQFYRPADRGQGADKRALGLRIYFVKLTPAS
jgi:hypothetical protein